MSTIKEKEEKEEETPWNEVWSAMKRFGWSWSGPTGLMTDYYYIKPGCKIKGGVEGHDYFICDEEVRQYARVTYKWGNVSYDALMKTIEEGGKCI